MLTKANIHRLIQLSTKSKARREAGLFIVDGAKMFVEAPMELLKEVYVTEAFMHRVDAATSVHLKAIERVDELKSQKDVIIEYVTDEQMKKISDTQTPQGILCVCATPKHSLKTMLDKVNGDGSALFAVLEDIQDPGNLGTIFRTGEGAGVTGIIMSKGTVDIFNPKTIRSTMGSVYRIPFVYEEDLASVIRQLKKANVSVYAAHLKGTKNYNEIKYADTAFLIGNEGNGLKDETAALADEYIKIPMSGQVESLNAAVATALLMYEHKHP